MGIAQHQPGRPLGLNLKQFIFPRSCIDRFVNVEGTVRATWFNGTTKWVGSGDKIFCAAKRWDSAADGAFMREIEGSYNAIAESCLKTDRPLEDYECDEVTRFFFLWRYRYEFCSPGGTMRSHLPLGRAIEMKVDAAMAKKPILWERIHFNSGSLIVPDRPPNFAYIPVSAEVALVSCLSGKPRPETLNERVKDGAKSFYFQFKEFVPRG